MKKIIFMLCFFIFTSQTVLAQQDMIGIPEGFNAPEISERDYQGNPVVLSEMYADSPVVVLFYRGGWCPYCNRQLKSYQDNIEEFNRLGAKIIAISVDTPEKAAETVEEYDLDFTIVSNPEATTLHDYRLLYYVPDELNEKYLNEYNIDLQAASGRSDHLLAVPATFIINTQGKVVFSYANEDYKVRTPVEEVLEILRGL